MTKRNSGAAPFERTYRLLPAVSVAKLGERFYVYDGNAQNDVIVAIPTQRIPRRLHDVVRRLQRAGAADRPRSLEQLQALFEDDSDRSAVEILVRQGYIEPYEERPAATGSSGRGGSSLAGPATIRESFRGLIDAFAGADAQHFFREPRLFHLPAQLEDEAIEVAFAGVPFASRRESFGTVAGPAAVRALSQSTDFWFRIHEDGIYTDIGAGRHAPALLCKDVMLKDYGDLGGEIRKVADLFGEIGRFVHETVVPHRLRPLFVGGDHAVTFPIVDAFLEHHPDLCLVQLDAHTDMFFRDRVTYDHAATVSNLIIYSDLREVRSYGLRASYTDTAPTVRRACGDERFRERLNLHSIGALKRLLAEEGGLRKALGGIEPGRPCYLTVDLDVLSPGEIDGQVSVPAGAGLVWWELFEAVSTVMEELDVVACDVVEYNPLRRTRRPEGPGHLVLLLLFLIDGLARRRRRAEG